MTIYFDRTLPLFLTDQPTYDGIAVNVDTDALQLVMDLNALVTQMKERINESGAPEEYNQELAAQFVTGLIEVMENNYVKPRTASGASLAPNTSSGVQTEGN